MAVKRLREKETEVVLDIHILTQKTSKIKHITQVSTRRTSKTLI